MQIEAATRGKNCKPTAKTTAWPAGDSTQRENEKFQTKSRWVNLTEISNQKKDMTLYLLRELWTTEILLTADIIS